jgi:hypothetical protein
MDQSSIRDAMKSIVAEIGAVDWLSESERAALVNQLLCCLYDWTTNETIYQTETFITDVASRYNDVERFLDPHLSPQNNRRLILNIFDQLRVIKDQALERVRFKRKSIIFFRLSRMLN